MRISPPICLTFEAMLAQPLHVLLAGGHEEDLHRRHRRASALTRLIRALPSVSKSKPLAPASLLTLLQTFSEVVRTMYPSIWSETCCACCSFSWSSCLEALSRQRSGPVRTASSRRPTPGCRDRRERSGRLESGPGRSVHSRERAGARRGVSQLHEGVTAQDDPGIGSRAHLHRQPRPELLGRAGQSNSCTGDPPLLASPCVFSEILPMYSSNLAIRNPKSKLSHRIRERRSSASPEPGSSSPYERV